MNNNLFKPRRIKEREVEKKKEKKILDEKIRLFMNKQKEQQEKEDKERMEEKIKELKKIFTEDILIQQYYTFL